MGRLLRGISLKSALTFYRGLKVVGSFPENRVNLRPSVEGSAEGRAGQKVFGRIEGGGYGEGGIEKGVWRRGYGEGGMEKGVWRRGGEIRDKEERREME